MKIQFAKLNKYNLKDQQNPHLQNKEFIFQNQINAICDITIKKYKYTCTKYNADKHKLYICQSINQSIFALGKNSELKMKIFFGLV